MLLRMSSPIVLLFTIAVAAALMDKNGMKSHHLAVNNDVSIQEDFQVQKSSEDSRVFTSLDNKNENIIRKVRNVIPYLQLRWSNGKVPYVLDYSVYPYRSLILESMEDFHTKTCVRFVPRTNENNYIRLFAGQGCYSNVGMVGGQQTVSLGQGCMYKGTIVHELGHTIGFYNEQNRSDRDDYLEINWDNILPGTESEFMKLEPYQNRLFVEYDRNSVMLDGNHHFSRNGKSTMVDKTGAKLYETYDKPGLSKNNVIAIRRLYDC